MPRDDLHAVPGGRPAPAMNGIAPRSVLIGVAMGSLGVLAILFGRGVLGVVDPPYKDGLNVALNLIPGIAAFAAALPAKERPVANGIAAAALSIVIGYAAAVILLGPVLLLVALPLLVTLIPLAIQAYLGAIIGAWAGRRWRRARAVEAAPPDHPR